MYVLYMDFHFNPIISSNLGTHQLLKFPFSLVDDVASHVKLFKKARLKCRQQKTDPNNSADLDSLFFDAEVAMEASSQEGNEICRDLVATIQQEEFMYLQNVSEILLFLLMPDVGINFGIRIILKSLRNKRSLYFLLIHFCFSLLNTKSVSQYLSKSEILEKCNTILKTQVHTVEYEMSKSYSTSIL